MAYKEEMPQCFPAHDPATANRESPVRAIVGTIVRGPMKRVIHPTAPENPIKTSKREDMMIDPCNCKHENTILKGNNFWKG